MALLEETGIGRLRAVGGERNKLRSPKGWSRFGELSCSAGVNAANMRKIITIALASVLVLGAIAQVPTGVQGQKGKHAQGHHMMGKVMKQLNLSPAQMNAIKAIHQQAKAKIQALRSANGTKGANMAQIKEIRKSAKEQMLTVLTPAQRSKLQSMRAAMKARHKGIGKIQP